MAEERAGGKRRIGLLWLVLGSLLLGARSAEPMPAEVVSELVAAASACAPQVSTVAVPFLEEEALLEEAERLGLLKAIEKGRRARGQQRRLAAAVVREARARGLDPQLVAAVAIVESQFDTYAVSSQGAMGVMQVMPATASWMEKRAVGPRELFDSERNIALGTAYLAWLIEQFGRVDAALLAYNAGPNAARRLLRERRGAGGYAAKVLAEHRRLQERAVGMCSLPLSPSGG